MTPGNPKFRLLYAIWGFLECLGFGGLIYGWGSLVFVLKDEGLYLDLCHEVDQEEVNATFKTNATDAGLTVSYDIGNTSVTNYSSGSLPVPSSEEKEPGCVARDSRLTLVFTIASAMFCVGCFVMGQMNYKFGTRITRLGAAAAFIVGALLVAFTSNEVPWLIFPGLSLVGAGGITFLMTNMQISFLFPTGGSFIVGLFCGGFDASAGMQLMVKIGYENGITRQTSYIILACAHLLTLISTFLFLPKDFIQKPTAVSEPDAVADDKDAAVRLTEKDGKKNIQVQEEKQSLMSCMLSPIYILHVLWLSVLQLRFYFLLGSFNSTVQSLVESKEEVSHYTNVLMYVLICGLFSSPFAGVVCDFHTHLFIKSRSAVRRILMPSVIPLALTTTLCIIMSGLILIQEPQVLYAVFIFLLFFRSFMYTLAAGYIGAIFPSEYFGIMYGILIITGGIISMLQYALFTWAEASGFMQVNIFLFALMFITYGHPLYQWLTCRRAENSHSLTEDEL